MGIRRLKQKGFTHKVFRVYALFVVSLAVLILLIVYFYLQKLFLDNAKGTLKQAASRVMSVVDAELSEMDKLSTQVMLNKDVQNIMIKALLDENKNNFFVENPNLANELRQHLISINSPNIFARRIVLFNTKGDYVSIGTVSNNSRITIDDINSIEWIPYVESRRGLCSFVSTYEDPWGNVQSAEIPDLVFSVARGVVDFRNLNKVIGFVEVQQPKAFFETVLPEKRMSLTILDQNGKLVFSNMDDGTLDTQQSIESSTRVLNQRKKICIIQKSDYSGWKYLISEDRNVFTAEVSILQLLVFCFGSIIITVSILVIKYIADRNIKPLELLTSQINSIVSVDDSVDLTNLERFNEKDEIEQLDSAFRKMLSRLKASSEKLIRLEDSEARARLMALQAQINPHFIFNSLMAIKALANSGKIKEVGEICDILSQMMRYSASFAKEGKLSDEVKHVSNFLKLSKVRYEDELNYQIDCFCDDSIIVPRFIIQPIVENAFSHGFLGVLPPWQLSVCVSSNSDGWSVSVWNNGKGLSTEEIVRVTNQLNDILRKDSKMSSDMEKLGVGGLGLINVCMRLRLRYSSNAFFSIENTEDPKGVSVRIGVKNVNGDRNDIQSIRG